MTLFTVMMTLIVPSASLKNLFICEPGASGLPYYCTSICVRFGCTRLASCVDSKPKKKYVYVLP